MLKNLIYHLRRFLTWPLRDFAYLSHPLFNADTSATQIAQKQLLASYATLNKPLPREAIGFRSFSQFDEDGILLYIFSQIGMGQKIGLEIGADCQSDYFAFPESNLSNLLVNHDWHGLIIDASAKNIRQLRRFFCNCRNTSYQPPQLLQATLTRENLNPTIRRAGLSGEIDLFSLDIDSNDYWLLQALEVVKPRVLVLEINQFWQSPDRVTIPYQSNLETFAKLRQQNPSYFGASLTAMVKLAKKKGYRLVALNSFGHNAFFVRKDLGRGKLPTLQIKYLKKKVAPSYGMEWVKV